MESTKRLEHWQNVYTQKVPSQVSWYQSQPTVSLEIMTQIGLTIGSKIIDVGGGSSTLVDALYKNYDVTVLDISEAALKHSQDRLGSDVTRVTWLASDITQAQLPKAQYQLWHDRAVFHFLTQEDDQAQYLKRLRLSLRIGGFVLLATFAPDGPVKCSGLEVVRYDAQSLLEMLGQEFKLINERFETHITPTGSEQRFVYGLFLFQGDTNKEVLR